MIKPELVNHTNATDPQEDPEMALVIEELPLTVAWDSYKLITFIINRYGMKKLKTWCLLSIAGIIFITIGIYCFVSPSNAYVKLVKYSGIALLVYGFLLVAASFLHTSSHVSWIRERKWMHAESIVEFIFGILLVFNPLLSFIVFPFLIGYCILCVGILKIAGSLSMKKDIRGWALIVIIGMLLCIFGMLIVYYPFARVNDVTPLIGIFTLMMGTLTLFDAFRFRNKIDTLNMML